MASSPETYVFDTGPLIACARADLIPPIGELVAANGWSAEIPREVQAELQRGMDSGGLNQSILGAPWLQVVELGGDREISLFKHYYDRLGAAKPERNVGECAVLARAEARAAVAVVDDRRARKHGERRKVRLGGSIQLTFMLVRASYLSVDDAAAVNDQLREGGYRLPFDGRGFLRWAEEQGVLS